MTPAQRDELTLIRKMCVEIGLETFGRRGPDLVETSQQWKRNKALEGVAQIEKRIRALVVAASFVENAA